MGTQPPLLILVEEQREHRAGQVQDKAELNPGLQGSSFSRKRTNESHSSFSWVSLLASVHYLEASERPGRGILYLKICLANKGQGSQRSLGTKPQLKLSFCCAYNLTRGHLRGCFKGQELKISKHLSVIRQYGSLPSLNHYSTLGFSLRIRKLGLDR